MGKGGSAVSFFRVQWPHYCVWWTWVGLIGSIGLILCDLEGSDGIVEQWVFAAALAMTSTVALMMLVLYEVVAVQ